MKTFVLYIFFGFAMQVESAITALWFNSKDTFLGVQERIYHSNDSNFSVRQGTSFHYLHGNGEWFRFTATSQESNLDYWTVRVGTDRTNPPSFLGVKTYMDAQRLGGLDFSFPEIDFYGSGRGFNRTFGQFEVLEIERDKDGNITRFAADFSLFSADYEGNPGNEEIIGAFRFNSNVPIPEPSVATLLAPFILLSLRRKR